MEEKRATSQYPDICVCCGKPVPEGRMVCYFCETGGNKAAPCETAKLLKGIRRILGKNRRTKTKPRD